VIKLQDAGMFKNSTPENPARDCIKANECIEWLQQQVFSFVEMQNVLAPNNILYFCSFGTPSCFSALQIHESLLFNPISQPFYLSPNSSHVVSLQLKYSRTLAL
jgi:hypothetical protein